MIISSGRVRRARGRDAGRRRPRRTALTLAVALAAACACRSVAPRGTSSGCEAPGGAATRPEGPGAGRERARAGRERAIADARRRLRALLDVAGVPGLSVAVGAEGSIVWSEGFGFADRERGVPVTPRTLFRIARVTKVVTAAAVARLHEEGRLDLDAPITRYVPSWPDEGSAITARQLAGHLGGIRDYSKDDFSVKNIDGRRFASVTEALEIFKVDPPLAPPGDVYRYSTYGYALLGAVLEGAAGRDYLAYMREEILGPRALTPLRPRANVRAPASVLRGASRPGRRGGARARGDARGGGGWRRSRS